MVFRDFSDKITALFAEVTLLVHIQGLRIQHLCDNPILLFFIPSITTVNFYILAPHSKKKICSNADISSAICIFWYYHGMIILT